MWVPVLGTCVQIPGLPLPACDLGFMTLPLWASLVSSVEWES